MTQAQAIEAIVEAWATGWAARHPNDVPFTLTNEGFDSDGLTAWARLTVRHSLRQQITMGPPGTRRFENKGRIVVQLFGAVNVGDAPLATLCDDVRAVLESTQIVVAPNDYIKTFAGTPVDGTASANGAETDGRWAMKSVVIPFWYEEIG